MKWIIPFGGTDYVFDDERLTASEARLQKRVTEGMTPVAAEAARQELDPDAWVAALLIAAHRVEVDLGELDTDGIDLMAAAAATKAAAERESEARKAAAAPQD